MNTSTENPTNSKVKRASITELLINSTLVRFYNIYNDDPDNYRGCIMVAKNGAMLHDWLMREKAFEVSQDVKNEIWAHEKKMYLWQLREGLKLQKQRKQPPVLQKEFDDLAKENKVPADLLDYYKTGLVEWQLAKLKKEDITVNIIFPER